MAGDAFQKIKSSINRGVTTISIKTSSSLKKVKIRTHIDTISTKIQRLIYGAGEVAYEVWESGSSDFSVLDEKFSAIKQMKSEIARLEIEYESIDKRDNKVLGTPSADVTTASDPVVAQVEDLTCSNCGLNYTTPAKFCKKCGNKLQNKI
jgi:hypothetical protein